ncbi:hypothetical protein EBT16_00490 [bacterium]|nr:hypothetical protein [bacterium]
MSKGEDFLYDLERHMYSLPIKPDLSKAGVKFPYEKSCSCCVPDYETLCYISLWIALETNSELPPNIHARMIFGPRNKWVEIYVKKILPKQ